jgi:heme a synthase
MSRRSVLIWLSLISTLILGIIIVGGITRLTNSGLSMVEWRPVYGLLPPLTSIEWERIFGLYQQSPEFIHHNYSMDLSGFKKIFFWEYLHRVLGRVIGIVIIIGAFLVKEKKRAAVLVALVVGQGLMGWYMVKSGLVSRPEVSHLRLSAHLGLALLLLQVVLWWILDLIIPKNTNKKSNLLHYWSLAIVVLTGIQIIYGAFMAGLKAGYLFNTFPSMGGFLIPPSLFIQNPLLSNFYNNPILVQFIHRGLAWFLLIVIVVFHSFVRRRHQLNLAQTISIHLSRLSIVFQFLLGVLTLIYVVPLPLALAHQIGGVLLLSSGVYMFYVFQSK